VLDEIELTPEDFYGQKSAEIFRSAKNLRRENKSIDTMTLIDEIVSRKKLVYGDVMDWFVEYGNTIPRTDKLDTYAKLIRQLSVRRRIISECLDLAQLASNQDTKHEELLTTVSSRILAATTTEEKDDRCVLVVDALQKAVEHISEIHAGTKDGKVLKTGLHDLDAKLCGPFPGESVVIAGRPGMGKSALALDIAEHAAFGGKPVINFSAEMSTYLISTRILSKATGINSKALRTGRIGDSAFSILVETLGKYENIPLYIDDSRPLTIERVYAKCRKVMKERGEIGALVFDYLQLMSPIKRGGTREQEVSGISSAIKDIAGIFNCVSIAISQLNRGVEQRPDKRPTMSDLRESGAIEQDADTIIFVYRDEVYNPNTADNGTAEIIIGKARSGETGMVRVGFHKELTKFYNLENRGSDGEYGRYWNEND
jgi:replicative DNA helicase